MRIRSHRSLVILGLVAGLLTGCPSPANKTGKPGKSESREGASQKTPATSQPSPGTAYECASCKKTKKVPETAPAPSC